MSFYCPHYDEPNDACMRIRCMCVPGRRGCVLRGKVQFLVDPEIRVQERQAEQLQADRRARASARDAASGTTRSRPD